MVDNGKIRIGYTVWDMLNSSLGTAEPDTVQANSTEYIELLNSIRTKISEVHANTLNGILTNPNAHSVLMPIILGYVTEYVNNTNDLSINVNRTAERIYQDMAGFGILTPYLNDPTVEEININAWNSIEVLWADREIMLEETFSSPQECVDIIKKMVRIGGVHIDYSQPIIDSFIGDGTRISATLPPVNTDQVGATASIRKQTYKNVTREQYINMGFATDDVFDFVTLNLLHNTSIGIAGSPGAGKTTFATCLLRFFSKNKTGNNRIVTIEEAREIELAELEKFNPSGGHPRMTSRTLQWNTTHSEDKPVTARALIRQSLRVNPAVIVPAEMRGGEAMEAVEAGQTGVQILSTFHAWGAEDGYLRVLSMCQMAGSSASEATIMNQIIKAFPIMVFIKKDDDGVRRIHEIFEATGVENGHVVGNTIYRFIRTKVIENEDGKTLKIYGDFVQCDSISKNLRHLLIQHGAKRAVVDKYYFTEKRSHNYDDYDESNVEVEVVETNQAVDFSASAAQPESFVPTWQQPVYNEHQDEPTTQQPTAELPPVAEAPLPSKDGIGSNNNLDNEDEMPSFLNHGEKTESNDYDENKDTIEDIAQSQTTTSDTDSIAPPDRPKSFWGGMGNTRRK